MTESACGARSTRPTAGAPTQQAYNEAHGITPVGIRKAIRDITERVRAVAEAHERVRRSVSAAASCRQDELYRLIRDLEAQMKEAAKALEFEKAALLRDQIIELRRTLAAEEPERIVPPRTVQRQPRRGRNSPLPAALRDTPSAARRLNACSSTVGYC